MAPVFDTEQYDGAFSYKIMYGGNGVEAVMIIFGKSYPGPVGGVEKWGRGRCEWFNHEMVATISILTSYPPPPRWLQLRRNWARDTS